jgi:hypothetical protein
MPTMRALSRSERAVLKTVCLCLGVSMSLTASAQEPGDPAALRKACTFYASFEKEAIGDFGEGDRTLWTRSDKEGAAGQFVREHRFDPQVFRIAKGQGFGGGGALECLDVLPRRGRIYFPLAGKLAFKKGGWSGACSLWVNTNPNKLLKTPFCDPVQITQRGANDGGIWCDFPESKPRDFRLGVFPAVPTGAKPIAESDPQAPLVKVAKIDFEVGTWRHVVLNWRNFDTGRADGYAALYLDGKRQGALENRELAMDWSMEEAGLYTAVNYIGLLDELALFGRELTEGEIRQLHDKPDVLAPLR